MKLWNVMYEEIKTVTVKDGQIRAEVEQKVIDADRQQEIRQFVSYAPVLTVA